jgi:hypothetical protein
VHREALKIGTVEECLRIEGTAEVNSSRDGLELGEVNVGELVVAGNNEATLDSLENGHADVGQGGVVVEGQIGGGGQVRGGESLELSTPEAELALELLQGGHGDRADVTEGHVGGRLKVGELNLELVPVTSEVNQVGGVLQVVDVDGLQVGVVGDLELADSLEGDTVQGGKTSVGDDNVTSIGNTSGESQGLKGGESLPVNLTNGGELSEAKLGEKSDLVQGEAVGDGHEGGGDDAGEGSAVGTGQGTGDLLDTAEGKGTGEVRLDLDVTTDGGAAVKGIGIALGGDGGIAAGWETRISLSSSTLNYSVYSQSEARASLEAANAGRRYLTKDMAILLRDRVSPC